MDLQSQLSKGLSGLDVRPAVLLLEPREGLTDAGENNEWSGAGVALTPPPPLPQPHGSRAGRSHLWGDQGLLNFSASVHNFHASNLFTPVSGGLSLYSF